MKIDLQYLLIGIVNAVVGIQLLRNPFGPHLKSAKRLAELDAGAPERYFEERRALMVYPAPTNLKLPRFRGGLLVVLGATLIGLAFLRPN